jgi:hypothetical protein
LDRDNLIEQLETYKVKVIHLESTISSLKQNEDMLSIQTDNIIEGYKSTIDMLNKKQNEFLLQYQNEQKGRKDIEILESLAEKNIKLENENIKLNLDLNDLLNSSQLSLQTLDSKIIFLRTEFEKQTEHSNYLYEGIQFQNELYCSTLVSNCLKQFKNFAESCSMIISTASKINLILFSNGDSEFFNNDQVSDVGRAAMSINYIHELISNIFENLQRSGLNLISNLDERSSIFSNQMQMLRNDYESKLEGLVFYLLKLV